MKFSIKKPFEVAITLATALIGGALFTLIHLPIPWLLGPMLAVLLGSSLWKGRYEWPGQIRNIGMIIIGYTIGLSMTSVRCGKCRMNYRTCC